MTSIINIREEIEQAIHTCIANPNQRVNSDKAANATKAVLSIIEKRIDSIYFRPYRNMNEFQHNHTLDKVKEILK